jgi:hypothetical protein
MPLPVVATLPALPTLPPMAAEPAVPSELPPVLLGAEPAIGNEANVPAVALNCEPELPEVAAGYWPEMGVEPALFESPLKPVPAEPNALLPALGELDPIAPLTPAVAVSPHAQLPKTPFGPHVIVPNPPEQLQVDCMPSMQPRSAFVPESLFAPQPTTDKDTATLAVAQINFIHPSAIRADVYASSTTKSRAACVLFCPTIWLKKAISQKPNYGRACCRGCCSFRHDLTP